MSQKSQISLLNFFIFNSKFAPKEGEEEKKILYYFPNDTNTDTKIKDIGLCEAIIKFINTFTSSDDSCQMMRTQKTTQFYLQPEPDYWMIMTINVPFEKKVKDGGTEYTEYKGDDVHEKIFKNVLKQAYLMFRLFSGTFCNNFIENNYSMEPIQLIENLEEFYSKYLLTLKLQNCDILNVFRSIQYLPLNKSLFLRTHNFIQMIQSTFSGLKYCIFLFNDQLIWSDINPADLYSIYEYLIGTLLSTTNTITMKQITPGENATTTTTTPSTSGGGGNGGASVGHRRSSSSVDTSYYSAFVTGPNNPQDSFIIPKLHIFNECDGTINDCIYQLIVYRSLNATICMFFEDKINITDDTYHELHSFIGPQLSSISTEISENYLKSDNSATTTAGSCSGGGGLIQQINGSTSSAASSPRYLFFNELNFKHTGTIHLNLNNHLKSFKLKKQANIPGEVMNLLVDSYDPIVGSLTNGSSEETVVKTLNDYWIVRRSSNWRHFYVIINKNATLLDVTEEAKKLFDQHASNVYFK